MRKLIPEHRFRTLHSLIQVKKSIFTCVVIKALVNWTPIHACLTTPLWKFFTLPPIIYLIVHKNILKFKSRAIFFENDIFVFNFEFLAYNMLIMPSFPEMIEINISCIDYVWIYVITNVNEKFSSFITWYPSHAYTQWNLGSSSAVCIVYLFQVTGSICRRES